MKKKVSILVLLLAILAGSIVYAAKSNTQRTEVTVIGGADGPTSIFLATKVNAEFWWMVGLMILAIMIMVVLIIKEHKKKK